MQTAILVYKLKNGVKAEDYMEFSKQVDQPLIRSYNCVKEFSVHMVLGPDKSWDFFEILKVTSWSEFEKTTQNQRHQDHAKEWERYADSGSLKIFYGNKIE